MIMVLIRVSHPYLTCYDCLPCFLRCVCILIMTIFSLENHIIQYKSISSNSRFVTTKIRDIKHLEHCNLERLLVSSNDLLVSLFIIFITLRELLMRCYLSSDVNIVKYSHTGSGFKRTHHP